MVYGLLVYASVAATLLVTDVAFSMQVVTEAPWWVIPVRAFGWPWFAASWLVETMRGSRRTVRLRAF